MRKSVSAFLKSDRLSPGSKGILLVRGAYFVTIWVAILISSFAIMHPMGANNCITMGRPW